MHVNNACRAAYAWKNQKKKQFNLMTKIVIWLSLCLLHTSVARQLRGNLHRYRSRDMWWKGLSSNTYSNSYMLMHMPTLICDSNICVWALCFGVTAVISPNLHFQLFVVLSQNEILFNRCTQFPVLIISNKSFFSAARCSAVLLSPAKFIRGI